MPSVRTMADWAGVNVNTVRAVYARLEDEGLIVTRHGRGSFVADDAPGSPEVERIAAEAIEAARAAGVDPREVAITALVSALPTLEAGLEEAAPASRARPRRATSELELDDTAGGRRGRGARAAPADRPARGRARHLQPRPRPRPPRAAAGRGEPPRRRRRGARGDPRRAARPARGRARRGDRRARRERRAREVRDAMVADPAGHRWEVVSSADTGELGCSTWQVSPGSARSAR